METCYSISGKVIQLLSSLYVGTGNKSCRESFYFSPYYIYLALVEGWKCLELGRRIRWDAFLQVFFNLDYTLVLLRAPKTKCRRQNSKAIPTKFLSPGYLGTAVKGRYR